MANPEHLEIIAQGVETWNAWRKENERIRPDLTGADLSGLDLTEVNFFAAFLNDTNLAYTILHGANLSGADLGDANLTGAYLNCADLMATNFSGADLRGADLSQADMEMSKLQNALLFEGNHEHLAILGDGVDAWNSWRSENENIVPDLRGVNLYQVSLHHINLSGANLSKACFIQCYFFSSNLSLANLAGARLTGSDLSGGVNLVGADLNRAYLSRTALYHADLTDANLSEAVLFDSQLSGATLVGADFSEAYLIRANFSHADLTGVNLTAAELKEANFSEANLTKANLSEARPHGARFSEANLTDANLTGADLTQATLVRTIFDGASLSNSYVYGVSAWDLDLSKVADQSDLVITPFADAAVTVDNLEVAQFIYVMLNNKKIRDVIDTVTGKGVLILGRFTGERKKVLDGIKERLQELNFVPMVFDWDKPTSRDLTETVQLLANMSRFVVADVTDAKSIPQELQSIVPNLPSVPIRPIILSSQREYAMFEHFKPYPWMLPVFEYNDFDHLMENIPEAIINPIDEWEATSDTNANLQEQLRAKDEENERLRAEIAEFKSASAVD